MRWNQIILALGFMTGSVFAQQAVEPGQQGAAFSAEGTAQEAVADTPASKVDLEKKGPGANPWDLAVDLDPAVSIRKIYDFLNDPEKAPSGGDKAMLFDFKYFNHGAITESQIDSRKGQYYVVSWVNRGAAADCVLRIDYRQAFSRDKVNTMEIPFAKAKGSYKGTFSVTGKDYADFGNVQSWRISVVRDGRIVAQERSFIW